MAKAKAKRKKTGGRVSKVTSTARAKFLASLAEVPNVALAADRTAISKKTWYLLRRNDDAFAEAWDDALEIAVGKLEEAARQRGVEGVVRRPIFSKTGKHLGDEMEYSDTLLARMLGAHHSSYRQRTEISGPDGGPIPVDYSKLSDVELERLAKIVAKLKED